jgi:hypothetical protein
MNGSRPEMLSFRNSARTAAFLKMENLAQGVDYTATIERSGEPGWPFAVVVTAHDGEEIARKRTKTEKEAQAFLELMFAFLEWRIMQETGIPAH